MSNILNERMAVGAEIAPPLRGLEQHIESAVENAGELLAAIARGRHRAKAPFATGIKAIDQINACLSAMVAGARSINDLHTALDSLRGEFGIPARAYGDYGTKPGIDVEDLQPLRVAG